MDIIELVNILHMENCSCAIWSEGNLTLCHKRGIIDLYSLLTGHPSVLSDAKIADKVIGKGAATMWVFPVPGLPNSTTLRPCLTKSSDFCEGSAIRA